MGWPSVRAAKLPTERLLLIRSHCMKRSSSLSLSYSSFSLSLSSSLSSFLVRAALKAEEQGAFARNCTHANKRSTEVFRREARRILHGERG